MGALRSPPILNPDYITQGSVHSGSQSHYPTEGAEGQITLSWFFQGSMEIICQKIILGIQSGNAKITYISRGLCRKFNINIPADN